MYFFVSIFLLAFALVSNRDVLFITAALFAIANGLETIAYKIFKNK